jgi:phosphatidylglycerophosphatase A
MNREDLTFGLDSLPPGVEPWSVVALLGTWWGAGLVAPFRSFLAILSVLLLLLALPVQWRARAALALWSMASLFGLFVGRFWSQATGITDDNRIVIDEIAGALVAVAPVINGHIAIVSLGAVLFSALDKLKPWPVSLLENELFPWSLGVALDDIAAGLVIAGLLAGGHALQRMRRSRRSAPTRIGQIAGGPGDQ